MKPQCHRVCVCVAPTKSDCTLRACWKAPCVMEETWCQNEEGDPRGCPLFVAFVFGQMLTVRRAWEPALEVMNSKLISLGAG